MSTFQAIIYSLFHAFGFFYPISESAHHRVIHELLGWDAPPVLMQGAMWAGVALSILLIYRHEWASILSSILRIAIYRKKPMTFDERIPFFLTLLCAPTLIALFAGHGMIMEWSEECSFWILVALWIAPVLLYKFVDSLSKRHRGLLDWNWIDSLGLGLFSLLGFLPGVGFAVVFWIWATIRHFGVEGRTRFLPYALMPIAIGFTIQGLASLDFSTEEASMGISWLTYGVGFGVAFLSSLLALGGILRSAERGTGSGWIWYRILVPIVASVVYWFEQR